MKKKDLEDNSEGEESADGEELGDGQQKPRRKQVECIMGNYTEEQLRNMHPQRSTFDFKLN
jgi:hypothetical protein